MLKVTGLIALLAISLLSAPVRGEDQGFKSYLFDGSSFREGKGAGAVLVKEGRLPVVAGEGIPREDLLPPGTGAVALLCYLQSFGGKLKRHPSVVPIAGVPLQLRGSGITLAARTDASGYLILALPPGNYQVRLGSSEKTVVIEGGTTTLAFLRGGKRMVD